MSGHYVHARGDQRAPREVFAAEYPRGASQPLSLRHGGQITVGERIEAEPALRLAHGKTYDYTTVGATVPRGLDLLTGIRRLAPGVCEVRFADTARAVAVADANAQVWCTCGRPGCVHRLAAVWCAGADRDAPAFSGEPELHAQLAQCLDEYLEHRDLVAFLLRAADAGYVVFRHATSIDLDAPAAREWFVRSLPPRIPHRDLRSSLFGRTRP